MKRTLKQIGHYFSELITAFNKHDVMTLSAALSFYTTLAMAPLLVITLAAVGLLGESSQNQFLTQIHYLIGDQAAEAVTTIIQSANHRPKTAGLAGVLGILVLFFTSSGVFSQLVSSLNVIWETDSKSTDGIGSWIKKRLLSLGMVLSLGFLSMVSLLVSAVLTFFFTQHGFFWNLCNVVVSTAIFSFMFAALFKYLPKTELKWRKALIGGFTTAAMFAVGKGLIGLYLRKSAMGSAYGAASSLVVLLAWIYYSSLIIFTGAEVTHLLDNSDSKNAKVPSKEKFEKNIR